MQERPFGFTVVTVLMFWVTMAFAIATFWPVYQHPSFLLATGGALVLGTIVALAGSILRLPSWTLLLAGVAVFLIAGVPLAVPSKATDGFLPTPEGELDLITGAALGWKQLLTIVLPVGDYQSLLVPPFLIVLAATIGGLSIALRARWGELGAIAPLAVFTLGLLFGPERVEQPILISMAEVASLLMWMAWRRAYRRRASIQVLARQAAMASGGRVEARNEVGVAARSLVAAAAILALAVGVGTVAATSVPPTADRAVLRTVVAQPFDPRDHPSPLAGLRRYLRDDEVDETMLTVTGLPRGERVRVATLDSYDGVVYAVGSDQVDSVSGTFVRIPTALDESSIPGSRVSVAITTDAYRGVWLPTVGALESVRFGGGDAVSLRDEFYYNRAGRTAALLRGVPAGTTYVIDAVLPTQPDEEQLAGLTPGTARVPAVSAVPEELSTAVEEATGGIEGAGAQFVAAIEMLRTQGYISHGLADTEPPSRSGHGVDRIDELFAGDRMIGDAEQYAVAASLMARQLGFPARVVMGFAPGDDETSSGGAIELLGSDITAWVEVDTAEYGWVAVDPVPPVRPIPDELPEEPAPIARPQFPVQVPPDDPEPRTDQTPPDVSQDDQEAQDPIIAILLGIVTVLGWTLLGALVVLSPLLVVLAVKWRRRRRRRRAPTPVARVAGAWDQFRDDALDRGIVGAPSATRSEFAETVGLQQSKTLAAVADRAVFAPEQTDADDAERVWLALDDLGESLDRGRSRWERLKARVSVRSLRASRRTEESR